MKPFDSIKECLYHIWIHISLYATEPYKQIPNDVPSGLQEIRNEIELAIKNKNVLVDSPMINDRPQKLHNIEDLMQLHSNQLEFVLLLNEEEYWAITEEEYHWFLFKGSLSTVISSPKT